jgi:hypothetical protein
MYTLHLCFGCANSVLADQSDDQRLHIERLSLHFRIGLRILEGPLGIMTGFDDQIFGDC